VVSELDIERINKKGVPALTYYTTKKEWIKMIPKFRAWDKEDKRMSYGEIEYYDDSFGVRFDHFCVGADFEVEFMQSTGLKDKNGVEIFDGDCFIKNFRTIEIPTGKDGIEKAVGIVKFHEGAFHVHIVGWGYELLSKVVKPQMYGANNDYWESEVIGNIYENPELLEVE
jgi:uncharacterized phage protein (TIGR01671 family)